MSSKNDTTKKGRIARARDSLRSVMHAYKQRAVHGTDMDEFFYVGMPIMVFYLTLFLVAEVNRR
jgi:hypothetical protein